LLDVSASAMIQRVKESIFNHVLTLDLCTLRHWTTQELISEIDSNTDAIATLINSKLLTFVKNIAVVFIGTIWLLAINYQLTLMLVSLTIVYALWTTVQVRVSVTLATQVNRVQEQVNRE
jgi:ABC-type bacteriocin/lantibiotic exporter with double-glycine peptidase domain